MQLDTCPGVVFCAPHQVNLDGLSVLLRHGDIVTCPLQKSVHRLLELELIFQRSTPEVLSCRYYLHFNTSYIHVRLHAHVYHVEHTHAHARMNMYMCI